MHIIFLSARLPLTKTFAKQGNQYIASPYPHVSRVTSHSEEVRTLNEFYKVLQIHAKQAHCLFSGLLQHPLNDESRAGKTKKEERHWICFDFDKVKAKSTEEVITKYLPAYCQDVSYIAQLSASMFRPDNKTWSGHIFMLLKVPVDEDLLKKWFEHLNFTIPALEKQISLTDSLQALHWPLDRTVAATSKLVYIAPPVCHGFDPKVAPDEAITLVKKKNANFAIPFFTPIDNDIIRDKINKLRKAINEPEITYNIQSFGGDEILQNAAMCDINGVRTSGDHYVRFNLNGGDSYGYYIDLRNPGLIRNFKGEPCLRTDEVAPEYFKALRKSAPKSIVAPPLEENADVFAFYATNRSSAIYVGKYLPISRQLELNTATETAAKAWLSEYSIGIKGYLPHVNLVFDPHNPIQYIYGSQTINTFRPSDYMNSVHEEKTPSTLADIPPTIRKTLISMLGDPDDVMLDHFINWIAFIFQKRDKTGTAWVVHGAPGTGKGTFIRYVITPILGGDHVKVIQFGAAQGEFNSFLEGSLLVVFEEADTRAVQNSATLNAKLKHWITDSPVEIRRMRTDGYSAPSYCNLIFNSNERTPAHIASDDRRFNVANRQEKRVFFTPNEWEILTRGDELEAFAAVLSKWPVNETQVTQVIGSTAKDDIHEASTSINQLIAEAVMRGDLQFFIDRIPSDSEAAGDFFNRFNPMELFKGVLETYTQDAETRTVSIVRDEDLYILFRTLVPDVRYFQDSKTWRKRHYKALGLDLEKQHRVVGRPNDRVRGLAVQWQTPERIMPAKLKVVSRLPKKGIE